MRRTSSVTVLILLCLLLFGAGVALAFGMGNVDGVWEYVEDAGNGGADCDSWATGPGSTPDSPTSWSRSLPSVQTGSTTDENQVRYGVAIEWDGDYVACTSTDFDEQSGLGFDGNDNVGASLLADTPFWLGRLSHYNKTIGINSVDGSRNYLEWVDLDVTVMGIVCGNGQPPNEGTTLTFVYRITFDETPNDPDDNPGDVCPYGDGEPCADGVLVGANPSSTSFTCDDADEPIRGVYTIDVLGFQPVAAYNGCATQVYDADLIDSTFVSDENGSRHACLWAEITDFRPTGVELGAFGARPGTRSVLLRWETYHEVNRVGFNLYRSTRLGAMVQVNEDLIPSQVSPGSVSGASYRYVDAMVPRPGAYYYWLEIVGVDGDTERYGPISATVSGVPGKQRLPEPAIRAGQGRY